MKKTCKRCRQPIEFVETVIDDLWVHVETRLGFCDSNENFLTAKDWAEPADERWENVWASISKVEHDIEKRNVEYRIEVAHGTWLHRLVRRVRKDKLRAEVRFDHDILDEMIQEMDEMIGAVTKEKQ